METRQFTGCCTAKIICNFGESTTSGYHDGDRSVPFPILVRELRRHIRMAKESGNACVVCTTTTEQETINKALTLARFYRSIDMKKPRHDEVDLILWYLPLFTEA